MAKSALISFKKRRITAAVCLVVAVAALLIADRMGRVALLPTAIYSGLVLMGLMVLLTLFNARKKLLFLPIFKASTWLQFHIYAGLFSLALFLVHIGWSFSGGVLEGILAAVFFVVFLSGLFGLYISRRMPAKLTRSGESLVYERIPFHRRRMIEEIEKLVERAEVETRSSTLADFYHSRMESFIRSAAPKIPHFVAPDRSPAVRLRGELREHQRYLSDEERELADELGEWLETKDNLDNQQSGQRLLKLWLFVHIPATYSLLILGVVHGILALLYRSL
jgi:hypothetical protein